MLDMLYEIATQARNLTALENERCRRKVRQAMQEQPKDSNECFMSSTATWNINLKYPVHDC